MKKNITTSHIYEIAVNKVLSEVKKNIKLLRSAEEQVEVSEFEANALAGLPHELIVACDVLGVNSGVRRRQQQPGLALARFDHERA